MVKRSGLRNRSEALHYSLETSQITKVLRTIYSCQTIDQINHTIDWMSRLSHIGERLESLMIIALEYRVKLMNELKESKGSGV